jgi:hypothetical protein
VIVKNGICGWSAFKELGKAGACEALVGLMAQHEGNEEFLDTAIHAVMCLCEDNEDNRIKFKRAGVVDILNKYGTATKNIESMELLEQVCIVGNPPEILTAIMY